MAEEMSEWEKLVQSFMAAGMTRQEAAFTADIELGILPRGDVIEVADPPSGSLPAGR